MHYVIGIGANLGDAEKAVAYALREVPIRLGATNVVASSLYRTAPVGGPDQPDFINAIVALDSLEPPLAALAVLQSVESDMGRVREVRWGPRTLDVDMIAARDERGDVVSDDPHLALPHPRAHERAFVVVPWLEVEPEARLPGRGPIASLPLEGLVDQRISRIPETGMDQQ